MPVTVSGAPKVATLATTVTALVLPPGTTLLEIVWGDGDKDAANIVYVTSGVAEGGAKGAEALPLIPGPSGRQRVVVEGLGLVGIAGSSAFDVHLQAIRL